MSLFEAIFLGVVQGITEFLPISSSGHLVLLRKFIRIDEPSIFFDTLIHFATLLAILFYLRKEVFDIIVNIGQKEKQKLVGLIVLATTPIVFFGFLMRNATDTIFNSLSLLSITFLITAVLLFATKFLKPGGKNLIGITVLDSLLIGAFQSIALLPGVSSSGSTISSALFTGIKREDAFKFSFLLAIPAIIGAMVLQIIIVDWNSLKGGFWINFLGFIAATLFGFLSLKILEKITIKGKLYYFAFYCLVLGLIILFFIR